MEIERMIGIVVIGVSLVMYARHLQNGKKSEYKDDGSYKRMTPMKHDLLKHAVLEKIMPFLLFGVAAGREKLWDSSDPYQSVIGKFLVSASLYLVYYQLVEPYIANKFPKW